MKKIIYDLGSNNGDDLPYYLKKGDLVVAVEANPILCEGIRERFSKKIKEGRLAVENFVVVDDKDSENVFFYRHKTNHRLSQFPEPLNLDSFDKILLPSKSILKMISEYGDPFYIKIDIEYYDEKILRCLFENCIRPPFISAESHSIEVFASLVAMGQYNAFKLVEGGLVSSAYRNHKIRVMDVIEQYSFPDHSAGPFGEDIPGEWMTANHFHRLLALSGLGWRDIHATNIITPNSSYSLDTRKYFKELCKMKISKLILSLVPKRSHQLIRSLFKH